MGLTNEKVDPDIRCPICGSDNIIREKHDKLLLGVALAFFNLPLGFIKGKYQCFDCYERWKA